MQNTPVEIREYVTGRQAVDAHLPGDLDAALLALWSQGFPALSPSVRLYISRVALSDPQWNGTYRDGYDRAHDHGRGNEHDDACRYVLGSILDNDRPRWPDTF